jgi:putative Holliday junction resolvase
VTSRTRILGVDHGTKRVGLAVSDADRKVASPLKLVEWGTTAADAARYRRLAEEEKVGRIVIGLPVHVSGREGERAAAARAFGEWLAKATGLPVVYWDERYTTVQAEKLLWSAGLSHQKRRERRDKVAAMLVLQAYLDAGSPEAPPPPGALAEEE